MLNVGLGIGFVPGIFYDRFGPTLTSGAGLIVSVPVYLLIWSTVKYTEFYSKRIWLMAIYFFLAGQYSDELSYIKCAVFLVLLLSNSSVDHRIVQVLQSEPQYMTDYINIC
jgi:hypothetical protein